MQDPNTVINGNDNTETRDRYFQGQVNGTSDMRFKKYIPAATYLIQKHCPDLWKHQPHSHAYGVKEFMICTCFEQWPHDRNQRILWFSTMLNCSAEALHNDPDLPF